MTEESISEETQPIIRQELRSPRSAAFAGIAYSLLMITGMLMLDGLSRARLEDITQDTLETWSSTVSIVLTMIPFAGIAFLWFTGVIRDRLGALEDKFFATLFLSAGIIQVVLLFVWGAVLGAMIVTRGVATIGPGEARMYLFGFALMNEIIGNYALRMAGIYMTAIATLWTRTRQMPRWLAIITYVLAVGFILAAERIREARFIFPLWVLVVSVYILILNYRHTHDPESDPERSMIG